jgi:hypothetical protein
VCAWDAVRGAFINIVMRRTFPPLKSEGRACGLTALWGVIEKEFGESREYHITRAAVDGRTAN